ncbi:MAG: uroporphyrinogen-III synthase [Rhodobacteraceae bacterium]|nr:uroporphyrinogen-III synthase [Paracoccaceae bacterium]
MQRAPAPVVLLTRPEAAARRFAALLRHEAGEVAILIAPLLGIAAVPFAAGLPARGLVFTSAEGVLHFAAGDPRRDLSAWCVGAATAAAARGLGFAAEAAGEDAEALVARLAARPPATPLLHARGVHARGAVAARLTALGIETAEVVVYDQPALPLTAAARAAAGGAAPLVLPLFSPRTAALAGAALAGAAAPLRAGAISGATAAAWQDTAGRPAEIAARPDGAAMLALTRRLLAAAARLEGAGGSG